MSRRDVIGYVSTQGGKEVLRVDEAILRSTAPDGGLYVPNKIPVFNKTQLRDMKNLSLERVMFFVMKRFGFGSDVIPGKELFHLIRNAYSDEKFTSEKISFEELKNGAVMAKLHNGPTAAFKDYALALVGEIVPYLLEQRGLKGLVLSATSGDTGPAAMANVSAENLPVTILYPYGGTSDGQESQMLYFTHQNGYNADAYAVKGASFDTCQDVVKAVLNDKDFAEELQKDGKVLITANSINWLRILGQIGYIAWMSMRYPDRDFYVPSGNSGHWLAVWYARQMGFPIGKIYLATNANDFLYRLFEDGFLEKKSVVQTLAPAMDIVKSSNLERFLYHSENDSYLNALTHSYGTMFVDTSIPVDFFKEHIAGVKIVDDQKIVKTIANVWMRERTLIDPHTATALYFAENGMKNSNALVLSTAHPAKFIYTVLDALGGEVAYENVLQSVSNRSAAVSMQMVGIDRKNARVEIFENDLPGHIDTVQDILRKL